MIPAACILLRFLYPTIPSLALKPSLRDTHDTHSMHETGWTASLRELAKLDLYHVRHCSIFPVLLWEPFARFGRC